MSDPVYDFSDQGFKLIGGRLDYMRKNEIAAVIYQQRQHYINLFVWPSQAGQPPDIITQKEGYNLYGWTAHGLTLIESETAAEKSLVACGEKARVAVTLIQEMVCKSAGRHRLRAKLLF